jgi:gliding motility-associated-like protein
VADFEANLQHCYLDTLLLADLSVTAQLSDDSISTWQYTLGNATTMATPNGQHGYAQPGLYDVQLLIATNHGCQDSISKSVEVFPLPQVGFVAQPQEGCEPLEVQFIDTSSIPSPYVLAGWQWNLGTEGQMSAVQNPMYVYSPENLGPFDTAVYDISLQVTSANGCVDSIVLPDYILVHPLPQALFSTDPQKVANIINPVFSITDLSTANVVSWDWIFGDGASSIEQNPVHSYADMAGYTIELMVETMFGCMDTISYTVNVEPNFTFYIPNSFTPNADGVNDYFFGIGEYISSYQMEIYDRWGELIFQSNDMEHKWDGTYRGKQVQKGQYVYRFYVTDWQHLGYDYVGSVYLSR